MKASVIGATGYAGVELLRLLDGHPEAEIAVITSESSTGEAIASMYPHLSGRIEKNLQSMQELDAIAAASDVIFIALPHGHAMKIGKQLRGSKTKIIDLGGDYRFKDYHVFEQWYKVKHEDPEAQAVYGLTELFRDKVRGAQLVANPGCYTTCSILALVPLDGATLWLFAGRRADHCVQRQPRPADAVSQHPTGRFLDRDFRPGAGRGRGDLLAQPGGDGGHALAGA